MPLQVIRLGLLFFALITGFIAFRINAVPDRFGEDGFHRAEASSSLAIGDLKHAGKEKCAECHPSQASSPHVKAGAACESCHGPSQKHAEDFEAQKPFVPDTRAFCARCHEDIPARRNDFPQVSLQEHNPGEKCISCHTIHPSEEQQ